MTEEEKDHLGVSIADTLISYEGDLQQMVAIGASALHYAIDVRLAQQPLTLREIRRIKGRLAEVVSEILDEDLNLDVLSSL